MTLRAKYAICILGPNEESQFDQARVYTWRPAVDDVRCDRRLLRVHERP